MGASGPKVYGYLASETGFHPFAALQRMDLTHCSLPRGIPNFRSITRLKVSASLMLLVHLKTFKVQGEHRPLDGEKQMLTMVGVGLQV